MLQQELQQIARGVVKFDESMREHTTIKIGGPADVWFEPVDAEDLANVTMWADKNQIPRMVFGNGSNTLVRDGGIRGIVISLAKFDWIRPVEVIASPPQADEAISIENLNSGDRHVGRRLPSSEAKGPPRDDKRLVHVGAGVPLQKLIGWSVENARSGLEVLTGIPGTLGGAIVMNAGTKDGSIGDVIEEIKILGRSRFSKIAKTGLAFSYRKLKLPRNAIIIEAELALKDGVSAAIEEKIEGIRHKRKEMQPLIWPSMGSVFKNPPHARKAWQLIDECDLRNVRVGGARISAEHANWIINENNATAKDVEVLINMIKEQVKEKFNLSLEAEIIIVGE